MSTRLTEYETTGMHEAVDKLLLRHLLSVKSPLTPDHNAALYSAKMDEFERRAWHAVRELWMARGERPSINSVPQAAVAVRMPGNVVLVHQMTLASLEDWKYPMWNYSTVNPNDPVNVADALGADAPTYIEWAETAVKVHSQVVRTKTVCDKVIDLAGTVGQLHHMCPDLVRYTYSTTREALERQQRRSPTPWGWENIDRRVLREAMDHLALCYLLPESTTPDLACNGFIYSADWIFALNTLGWATGISHPDYRSRVSLTSYDVDRARFDVKETPPSCEGG